MSYRIALERLQAYKPRRLIRCMYEYDGDCCAIGALVPSLRWHGSKSIHVILLHDPDSESEIRALGLTDDELIVLQNRNDKIRGSDEFRYQSMVDWLKVEVAKEASDETTGERE
jgi:hypothetical protein